MSNHLDYEINKELGECYLFMGDMDKAETYYQKAASSNGVHPDPYLGLATIAVQRGDMESALAMYSKAAGIEANDKSLAGMGMVKMELGQHEDAFIDLIRALEHNPTNAVALNCIVREAFYLSRVEEVLPYLNTTLEMDYANDNLRVTRAGCLISLGRTTEARNELEAVLHKNPEHEDARGLLDSLAA